VTTPEDLRTFTVAFLAAWALLAGYFVYLHVVEARLTRDVRELESRLDDDEGNLK
jgi:uncharacterized membrane protein YciS (DUF1049 family)